MKATPLWLLLAACAAGAQQSPSGSTAAGAASFASRCGVCHGGDGNGSARGPSLRAYVAGNPDAQIATLIRTGIRGMPAHTIADPEMTDLLAFLHTLGPVAGTSQSASSRRTIKLNTGASLQGEVLNETNFDLQLAGADGRIHLLTRDGDSYREPSLQPEVDWPRYDGSFTSNPSVAVGGQGYSPADFVIGDISNVQLASPLGLVGNRQWRAAGFFQERGTTLGWAFKGGLVQPFDLPPSFRGHTRWSEL